MLQGMTGYGTDTTELGSRKWVWELRSLNCRYWECHCFLPEPLGALEPDIRRRIQGRCWRGKIEVRLRYLDVTRQTGPWSDPQGEQCLLAIKNWSLAHQIQIHLDPIAYLNWLEQRPLDLDFAVISDGIWDSFERALAQLCQMREQEGAMIRQYLWERLEKLQQQTDVLERELPRLRELESERLLQRYQDWQVDPERTGEALASWSAKVDVGEELSRLKHHIDQGFTRLKPVSPQAVGRPMDFLIQEIQREVHTLSSKLGFTALSAHLLEMKILVDQLKEQVQNVA